MSLPAAYYPIEFSAHHRCGLQRLLSIIELLHINAFVVDMSLSAVSTSYTHCLLQNVFILLSTKIWTCILFINYNFK